MKGLSLSIDEANNYIKLGKKIYPISFAANESQYNYFAFRTENTVKKIIKSKTSFNELSLNTLSNKEIKNYVDKCKKENKKVIIITTYHIPCII